MDYPTFNLMHMLRIYYCRSRDENAGTSHFSIEQPRPHVVRFRVGVVEYSSLLDAYRRSGQTTKQLSSNNNDLRSLLKRLKLSTSPVCPATAGHCCGSPAGLI